MFGRSEKHMALAERTAEQAIHGRSLWKDAGDRFVRNKAAMVCLAILACIVLFTIIGPPFRGLGQRDNRLDCNGRRPGPWRTIR